MENSIAYSQALHLNKICCNNTDLEKTAKNLLKKLTNRGYDKTETMLFPGMKF